MATTSSRHTVRHTAGEGRACKLGACEAAAAMVACCTPFAFVSSGVGKEASSAPGGATEPDPATGLLATGELSMAAGYRSTESRTATSAALLSATKMAALKVLLRIAGLHNACGLATDGSCRQAVNEMFFEEAVLKPPPVGSSRR